MLGMVRRAILTPTKSHVVDIVYSMARENPPREWGSLVATLYRVHDGKSVVASFMSLHDALDFIESHDGYQLITADYYQNGVEETPAHIN